MEVKFAREAFAETVAAVEYYAERDPRTAARFREELDRAVGRIVAAPSRWPEHVHGTRRVLLRRFPFSVVYHVGSELIVVIAVAHYKRKPGYWQHRLAAPK